MNLTERVFYLCIYSTIYARHCILTISYDGLSRNPASRAGTAGRSLPAPLVKPNGSHRPLLSSVPLQLELSPSKTSLTSAICSPTRSHHRRCGKRDKAITALVGPPHLPPHPPLVLPLLLLGLLSLVAVIVEAGRAARCKAGSITPTCLSWPPVPSRPPCRTRAGSIRVHVRS